MNDKCSNSGCEFKRLPNNSKCLFHAPKDQKGISDEEFNRIFFDWLGQEIKTCAGFVFPCAIDFAFTSVVVSDFRNTQFHGRANFSLCDFASEVTFSEAKFLDGVDFTGSHFAEGVIFVKAEFNLATTPGIIPPNLVCMSANNATFEKGADFREAVFKSGSIEFNFCKFRGTSTRFNNCYFGGLTYFIEAEFIDVNVYFVNAHFAGGNTHFTGAIFERDAIFTDAKFSKGNANFIGCQFRKGDANFQNTTFTGGEVNFSGSAFGSDVIFIQNEISHKLSFADVRFNNESKFLFTNPIFKCNADKQPVILFKRTRFIPFLSFFENISPNDTFKNTEYCQRPAVLFRQCSLKDVYFSNNDMSLFSFFGSAFYDEAHINSCQWINEREKICFCIPKSFERKNIIIEEKLLKESIKDVTTIEKERFDIALLNRFWQVAELYRHLKASADRAKDYGMAGWFYFNEIEMKRLDIIQKIYSTKKGFKKAWGLIRPGRLWFYYLYKVFAGYGEKPFWSLSWLGVFTLVFACIHLFNGIDVPGGRKINYDWGGKFPGLIQYCSDLSYAILFTLYQIMPTAYLPFKKQEFKFADINVADLSLSFFNIFILSILIIFTIMGFKRHFRRF